MSSYVVMWMLYVYVAYVCPKKWIFWLVDKGTYFLGGSLTLTANGDILVGSLTLTASEPMQMSPVILQPLLAHTPHHIPLCGIFFWPVFAWLYLVVLFEHSKINHMDKRLCWGKHMVTMGKFQDICILKFAPPPTWNLKVWKKNLASTK